MVRRTSKFGRHGETAPGQQERSVQTRAMLLRAATAEFSEHGLAGARVDRIAEAAGTNKQAVYYYFENKEILFKAALMTAFEELMPDVSDIADSADSPEKKIENIVRKLFDRISKKNWILSLITFENLQKGIHLDKEVRENLLVVTRPFLLSLQTIVKEGVDTQIFRNIDSMLIAHQLFALTEFYFTNQYTVSLTRGKNLRSQKSIAEWREHVIDVMLTTLSRRN